MRLATALLASFFTLFARTLPGGRDLLGQSGGGQEALRNLLAWPG